MNENVSLPLTQSSWVDLCKQKEKKKQWKSTLHASFYLYILWYKNEEFSNETIQCIILQNRQI